MLPAESLLQSIDEMLTELEPYLLSPELFWPLSSTTLGVDRFTLGNLILALDQLNAQLESLGAGAVSRFRSLEIKWERAQVKRKSAISRKASLEIGSRLNLWRAYVMDLGNGRGANFDYRQEVRNRVIIERLSDLVDIRETWEKELLASDRLLQSLIVSTDFIWPAALQSLYPRGTYWFLYVAPRKLD